MKLRGDLHSGLLERHRPDWERLGVAVAVLRLHNLVEISAGQRLQEFRDDDVFLSVVAKRQIGIDAIDVSTSRLATSDISSLFKVGDYFVGGSFSNPDTLRNFSSCARVIVRYVAEYQSVVRDEGPP